MALGELHDPDAEALPEQHLQALASGPLPRLVLVEVHADGLREAAQQPGMGRGERGTACRDRLFDPTLQGAGHVEVAFHENHPTRSPDRVACPREAVEHASLVVDRALGRVEVLGLGPVQAPGAERHDLPRLVQDRKNRPVAKAVIVAVAALAREDEARLLQRCRRVASTESAEEVVPAVTGRAGSDALECLLPEAPAEEVLPGRCPRRRPQRSGEVLRRRLHEAEHRLALLAVGAGLEASLGHGHPKASGERLQRLRKARALAQHQELEDVAPFAAAEAVEDRGLLPHVEGRGLLLVEGAQPFPRGAHLLEHDVVGDHLHDVGRPPHLLDESLGERHD